MTAPELRRKTLAAWKWRCALCPWKRTYKLGHVHHCSYRNYGAERVWIDVIPLAPSSHRFIHQWLGWGDRVSTQRLGRFPNLLQRLVHAWCRFTWILLRGYPWS